jgi:hypothetical protein
MTSVVSTAGVVAVSVDNCVEVEDDDVKRLELKSELEGELLVDSVSSSTLWGTVVISGLAVAVVATSDPEVVLVAS